MTTGNELVPLGRKLKKASRYDANGPQLLSLLASEDIQARDLGIAVDRSSVMQKVIRQGLRYDMLLISGGVSMGDYDLVPAVLKKQRVRPVFHKVRIKPGKPLLMGRRGNKVVFGLPGNPLSTFINYHLFVRPAIRKMMGHKCCVPRFRQGRLGTLYVNQEHVRMFFAPVKICKKNGVPMLYPVPTQGSSDVLSLARADGFMRVAPQRRKIEKGAQVSFIQI
jgi:molybdopterin molybdotransferase